jgi:hypothetical protein
MGHFCFPWKQKISTLHLPVPPLGKLKSGCFDLQFARRAPGICQPSLENNSQLVGKTPGESPHHVLGNCSLLGFSHLVAPFGQNESTRNSGNFDKSIPGFIQKLLGGRDATPKVAPPLSSVIRIMLERRKISHAGIQAHLKQLGDLQRYDNAFNLLWFCLQETGKNPLEASVDDIAEILVQMNQKNHINPEKPHQARNAFAACLQVPGLEHLRFHSLLAKCEKIMEPKYPKISHILGCLISGAEIIQGAP